MLFTNKLYVVNFQSGDIHITLKLYTLTQLRIENLLFYYYYFFLFTGAKIMEEQCRTDKHQGNERFFVDLWL